MLSVDFLNKLRFHDYNIYYQLYAAGLRDDKLGNIYFFFARYGIVFFFLTFTYLIWNKKINAFLCSFLAMGIAGFTDLLITLFWARPRPFISHQDLMTPVLKGLRVDTASFPSVHTYIVFAIAVSVFLYGHRKLGIILFVLAICVAISRIGTGLHYPSDIIGGMLLGLASGIISFLIFQKLEDNWDL